MNIKAKVILLYIIFILVPFLCDLISTAPPIKVGDILYSIYFGIITGSASFMGFLLILYLCKKIWFKEK